MDRRPPNARQRSHLDVEYASQFDRAGSGSELLPNTEQEFNIPRRVPEHITGKRARPIAYLKALVERYAEDPLSHIFEAVACSHVTRVKHLARQHRVPNP